MSIFIENPRWGGGFSLGGYTRGREGICGESGEFGGEGGLTFFFGAEMSTKPLPTLMGR